MQLRHRKTAGDLTIESPKRLPWYVELRGWVTSSPSHEAEFIRLGKHFRDRYFWRSMRKPGPPHSRSKLFAFPRRSAVFTFVMSHLSWSCCGFRRGFCGRCKVDYIGAILPGRQA